MNKDFRLSICIPTRNRAEILEKSLTSITTSLTFTNHPDIEVVVSDNASIDHTQQVVQRFIDRWGDRIRYFRNEMDVADRNFEISLRHGRGLYLKLANDSLAWSEPGLSHLYELVGVYTQYKPILYFLNGTRPTPEPLMMLLTPDELLTTVSFQLTWIGSFGIWREDLGHLSDFSRCANQQLVQVDVICRLITMGRPIIVSNIRFAGGLYSGRKGGYSIAKIFGVNYLSILSSFEGAFSAPVLAREKRTVLEEHILPFHFNPDHDFEKFPLEEYLDPVYGMEPYYRESLTTARSKYQPTPASVSPEQAPHVWRMRNAHNETYMVRQFDINRVTVGKASYGPLDVSTWGHPDERLSIGHFVSIAEGVKFLLGGNHPYKGFSTYPFKVKFLGYSSDEALTKGPIIVSDDVWLGTNAMILSGVTIGQGAVIGAGALVTADIPPYAIVAGNPARIIGYRFSPYVIEKMTNFDFGCLQPQALVDHSERLYEELTDDNIDDFLKQISRTQK